MMPVIGCSLSGMFGDVWHFGGRLVVSLATRKALSILKLQQMENLSLNF
jgi:hypothetical protein